MLIIRRIMEKSLQEELCSLCGVRYDAMSFAYLAAEGHMEPEGAVLDSYIGVLQFTMDNEGGYINTLSTVEGVEDDEALIIMTRATMEYMNSIELPYVYIDEDAAPAVLIYQMGFRQNEYGELCIDLERFYDEPCKYDLE